MNEASPLDCIFWGAGDRNDLSHYFFSPVLWSAISKFDVVPIPEDALEILAISMQELPRAMGLIAASHTCSAARHIHLFKLRFSIASSDLPAITCLIEHSVKACFTWLLSRPDVHVSSV